MGTQNQGAFEPRASATVSMLATVASMPVRFNDTSQFPASVYVRVWNSGAETVFIEFGDENVTATEEASMPIPAGQVFIFRPGGSSWMAAITHANTSEVYVTPGYGL